MSEKELAALLGEAEEVFSVLEQGNTTADEKLEELRKKREAVEDAEVDEVLDKRKAECNDVDSGLKKQDGEREEIWERFRESKEKNDDPKKEASLAQLEKELEDINKRYFALSDERDELKRALGDLATRIDATDLVKAPLETLAGFIDELAKLGARLGEV